MRGLLRKRLAERKTAGEFAASRAEQFAAGIRNLGEESIVLPDAPLTHTDCPCESGLLFADCHGVPIPEVPIVTAAPTPFEASPLVADVCALVGAHMRDDDPLCEVAYRLFNSFDDAEKALCGGPDADA